MAGLGVSKLFSIQREFIPRITCDLKGGEPHFHSRVERSSHNTDNAVAQVHIDLLLYHVISDSQLCAGRN